MKIYLLAMLMIVIVALTGCLPASGSNTPSVPQPIASVSAQDSIAQSDTVSSSVPTPGLTYSIVDTAQSKCYDNSTEIPCGQNFAGQDAQYTGSAPHYQNNGDGTVSDLVTGLMWQQNPGAKMTYAQAVAGADSITLAGYSDWRLPTIKELYSLILFDGMDASACMTGSTCAITPFIDTRYFTFSYGNISAGERVIDSQFATSSKYVSTTMNGDETMFGVNFADGRIKGYGLTMRGQDKTFYVLYVRGNLDYGKNNFTANDDDTITDTATGLTWMQSDSGLGMDWESALNYCEALDLGGSSDWRLPNAKELQSIVDYNRSPDTSNSAAINLIFSTTAITNEAGQSDYPSYWSSTTHADASGHGSFAAYVSFGRAMGYMNTWVDVHGAGAQRSDPKTGSASEYPQGHGPQGDAVRIENYVRCVTGGAAYVENGVSSGPRPSMQIQSTGIQQDQLEQIPTNGIQQPGGLNDQPPQEAVSACSVSNQGAACSFTTPNGTINGTCQQVQLQLACVPQNRP